ncbi:MAG: helix-turn-helix domain-containing protein [Gammaproteobacteria bacterium]|jgi:CRP/FNR family transcriptional regulator, anaerobic regulatory protein
MCANCYVRWLCLPGGLATADVERLASLVRRYGPLKRGETLHQAGTPSSSLYAVQSGALKTLRVAADGREQITGFHLAGDLIGLDAIDNPVRPSFAIALENTWTCEIPHGALETLSKEVPQLQRALMRLVSRELVAAQTSLMTMGTPNAEQRVLAVLIDICTRLHARFGSSGAFRLPITRTDIANYVGLTSETVSRVFVRLQDRGIIAASGRTVQILDPTLAQGHCR